MVVVVADDDVFKFTPLVSNLDFAGKEIIVPTRSSSMVECFAIDWLIVNLGLERVGILTSPTLIDSMVQRNAYSEDPTAPLTTAVELFSNESRELFVVQIRSEILNGKKFASKLSNFITSNSFGNVLIMSGSDSCFLTGEELEAPKISIVPDASRVVSGGIAKRLCELIEKREILVGMTRGKSGEEIAIVSREMALMCAKTIGISEPTMNRVPLSIEAIV